MAAEQPPGSDFAAEGLLEGLEGPARNARANLLDELQADGATIEQLRAAVAHDHLALLPLERLLARDARVSTERLADLCGLDVEFLSTLRHALGLRPVDPGDPAFREADVETFRRLGELRHQAWLSDEGMLEVLTVLGHGLWRTSEAVREMVGEALARAGDTEREIGLRYVEAAQALRPLAGPLLETAMRAHLVEGLRTEVLTPEEIASGRLEDVWEVAVCFVDLVGFTGWAQRASVEDVLAVTRRLAALAGEAAKPPVRLVKTIGDAVMLVSSDSPALVDALRAILAAVAADDSLPPARAGLAYGSAVTRGGDWHGRPVNLASRLAGVARPGNVLATDDVRDALGDRCGWSSAGTKRLKGIEGEMEVFELEEA